MILNKKRLTQVCSLNAQWAEACQFFEYTAEANPTMPPIRVDCFPASLHHISETRIIPLDLSAQLQTAYPATSPNLLANFLHIAAGEALSTQTHASSQVFYVLRGCGHSAFAAGRLTWQGGDFFAVPMCEEIVHFAQDDAALYWVHDAPLMTYLGVRPEAPRVRPLYFSRERLEAELARVSAQNAGLDKNRNGFLLANPDCPQTKTVTHSLWSLYNQACISTALGGGLGNGYAVA